MNVIRLKDTMLMNKFVFLEKTVFFLVGPETYWVMCYISYSPELQNLVVHISVSVILFIYKSYIFNRMLLLHLCQQIINYIGVYEIIWFEI